MAQRKLHDEFFRKAKAEGYLARSAYKLQEINQRHKVFGRGARVLDLGCAPGAWIQVALEDVGPRGVVVGIDLKDVRHDFGPGARVVQGDAYAVKPETLTGLAGGMFDAVLSDMAPDTTGHGDHFLSVRLCRRVLELLPGVLRHGGNLTMKVFEGEEYPALLRETGTMFASCRGFKPKASRDVSVEMYIVAHGYRGGPAAASERPVTASEPARGAVQGDARAPDRGAAHGALPRAGAKRP